MIKTIINKLKFLSKNTKKKQKKNSKKKPKKGITLFNCKASEVDYFINEMKADVNQINKEGKTPLFYASDKLKTIKLISNGADIFFDDIRCEHYPIFDAPLDCIPIYIKSGFKVGTLANDCSERMLINFLLYRISKSNDIKIIPGEESESIFLDILKSSPISNLDDGMDGYTTYLHSSTFNKIINFYIEKGVALTDMFTDSINVLDSPRGRFLELLTCGLEFKMERYNCSAESILKYEKINFKILHDHGFSLDGVLNSSLKDCRMRWYTDYVGEYYLKNPLCPKNKRDKNDHLYYALATADVDEFIYFIDNYYQNIFKEDLYSSDDDKYYKLLLCIAYYRNSSDHDDYIKKTKMMLKKIATKMNSIKSYSDSIFLSCYSCDTVIKFFIDLDCNPNVINYDNFNIMSLMSVNVHDHYKAHLVKKEKALIEEFIAPEDLQPRRKKRL
ncbi:hypothetical protein [Enterobacter cloacae complex sp. 418I7]|uniref:hypothetical protein n=1 Tax=Enterobacter cloacae complex sp. 418I7 TaxID=3395839 RepID=UPI003CFB2A7F